MPNPRTSRWSLGFAGFVLAVALAPAAPSEPLSLATSLQEPDQKAVHELGQVKIKAATEILAMCREFLVAPPAEKGIPAAIDVAEQIQYWSRQLTDAKLEEADDAAERIKILTEEFDRAKGFEAEIKDLAGNEASGLNKLSAAKAAYYRADAEARLIREKVAPTGAKKSK